MPQVQQLLLVVVMVLAIDGVGGGCAAITM